MSNFCRKGTDFSESPFTPDVCSTESQAEYFSPAAPYSQGACWSGPDFVPNAIRPLAPPEELSVSSLWADEVEPGPGVSPNLSVAPPQASAAEDRSGGSGGAPQNSRFHPLGTDVSPASTGAHGAPGVPPESLSDSNDVLALGASCNMAVGLPGRLSIGYGFTGGLGVGVSRGGGPLAYASVGHGPAIVPSVVSAGCSLDFNYSSDEDKFRGTGDSAGTGPMNLNFDDQGELHGFS